MASYKAMVLEGLEVVFVVIAVGAGRGSSSGEHRSARSMRAGRRVGVVIHRPLARVPENTLKFAVGVMLSAFGIFWTGEGLGVPWPGEDLAILGFGAFSRRGNCRGQAGAPSGGHVMRVLLELFVDDGMLALALLAVVVLAA